MIKYHFIACLLLFAVSAQAQESSKYFYKPFPIYETGGNLIAAGDIKTFVYSDYYGKNIEKEKYNDVHSKPEYLIYELFKLMKSNNINAISKLYDTTFRSNQFNANLIKSILNGYDDIKFVSKFKSGNYMIVRYNFVSAKKQYPYFAAIHVSTDGFYLTSELNLSDPFNMVGSLSPNNLPGKIAKNVVTNNMTPFYFVNRNSGISFTNQVPPEDYTAVYLAFNYYAANSNSSPEFKFIQKLQKIATSSDSANFKNQIISSDQHLLSNSYYGNYYYQELIKIFRNFSTITPFASVKINGGKLLYIKYNNEGQSALISSIIINEQNGAYALALNITDDKIKNILQNVYIREAILDYLKQK